MFLFTQELQDGRGFSELSLYRYSGDGWTPCSDEPIIKDASHARMAGRIINDGGRLIRPSQDCAGEYGRGVSFREIRAISRDYYEEAELAYISAEDIRLSNSKRQYWGVHTYNVNERYEVIDLKLARRVRLR